MRRVRSYRRSVVLLVAVGLILACPVCKKGARGPAVRIDQAPGFQLSSLGVIGYLGLGKAVPGEDAIGVMEPLVEELLLGPTLGANILPRAELERRAEAHDVFATYVEVRDFWRDAKKVDKFKAGTVCEAIGVDALLVGSVEDWQENRVSWGAEGSSFSRVALRLCIYVSGEGRPVWAGRCSYTMESEEYEPSEATTGRPLGSGSERVARRTGSMDPGAERAQRATPAPPPLDEVGRLVATALVQALAGN